MSRKVAVIVDAYSSGALLAPELSARGYGCLMIQSGNEVPDAFRSSFKPDQFFSVVRYENNIESLIAKLAEHNVKLILAGFETGVELADQLTERMNLASNGTKYSKARRDKFLMLETARQEGLHVPRQFRSNTLDEVIRWVRDEQISPVVIKPSTSSGSDNVALCATEAEISESFERILSRPNMLGLMEDSVVAQEYLKGTEYVVDIVSLGDEHRVGGYWKYGKPASGTSPTIGYDSMLLLSSRGKIQDELYEYAVAVLRALRIQYGPAHCELMRVGNTTMLIEVGARLSAGINAVIGRSCGDTCPLDLTIEAYLEPRKFLKRPARKYHLAKTAANFFLLPRRRGKLKALPRLAEIEKLQSFHRMSIGARRGEPVDRVVGLVTLMHPQRSIVEEDIACIRRLEQTGFYILES